MSDRRRIRHFCRSWLAALAASSVALAAGGVVGTYGATIKNSNHLNGNWVVAFTKGGTYTVAQNGNALSAAGTRRPRRRSRWLASPQWVRRIWHVRVEEVGEDDHVRPQARAPLVPGTRRDPRASIHAGAVAMNLRPVYLVVVTATLSAAALNASTSATRAVEDGCSPDARRSSSRLGRDQWRSRPKRSTTAVTSSASRTATQQGRDPRDPVEGRKGRRRDRPRSASRLRRVGGVRRERRPRRVPACSSTRMSGPFRSDGRAGA